MEKASENHLRHRVAYMLSYSEQKYEREPYYESFWSNFLPTQKMLLLPCYTVLGRTRR